MKLKILLLLSIVVSAGLVYDQAFAKTISIPTSTTVEIPLDGIFDGSGLSKYVFTEDVNSIKFETSQTSFQLSKSDCTFDLYKGGRISLNQAPSINGITQLVTIDNVDTPLSCSVGKVTTSETGISFKTTRSASGFTLTTTFNLLYNKIPEYTFEPENKDIKTLDIDIIDTCKDCTPTKSLGGKVLFGNFIYDPMNENHGTLTETKQDGSDYTFKYEQSLGAGEKGTIDPAFGYYSRQNYDLSVSTTTGVSSSCPTATGGEIGFTLGTENNIINLADSDTNAGCQTPTFTFPISVIPSGVTVTGLSFEIPDGLTDGAGGANCDFMQLSHNPAYYFDSIQGDGGDPQGLWDDIHNGTVYVNADSACDTDGVSSVSLGASAISDLQSAVTAKESEFSFGVKFDSETRSAVNYIRYKFMGASEILPYLSVTYNNLPYTPIENIVSLVGDSAYITWWNQPSLADTHTFPTGSGDGEITVSTAFAKNSTGHFLFTDTDIGTYGRIEIFDNAFNYAGEYESFGTGNGDITFPTSIAINSTDYIYVADTNFGSYVRVEVFDPDFNYIRQWSLDALSVSVLNLKMIFSSDDILWLKYYDVSDDTWFVERYTSSGILLSRISMDAASAYDKGITGFSTLNNDDLWIAQNYTGRHIFDDTDTYQSTICSDRINCITPYDMYFDLSNDKSYQEGIIGSIILDATFNVIGMLNTTSNNIIIDTNDIYLLKTGIGDSNEVYEYSKTPDVTGFKIERQTDSGGWSTLVADTGSTDMFYEDTTIEGTHTYDYRVSAINADGTSAVSNIDSLTVTAPDAPINLNAVGGNEEIALDWDDGASAGDGTLSWYGIRYDNKTEPTGDWITLIANNTIPNPREYLHTSIHNNIQLTYQVRHGTQFGWSNWSTNATAKTNNVPDPPTDLSATTVSTSAINLSWTAPVDDGGSAITSYKIERESPTGNGWSTVIADTGSTDTTYPDTGLTAGIEYNYRVSAISSVGTGISSSADATFTITNTPIGLSADFNGVDVELSWTAPSGTVTGYKIEEKVNQLSFQTIEADTGTTDTTYVALARSPLNIYTYRVSAINAGGTSSASSTAATSGGDVGGGGGGGGGGGETITSPAVQEIITFNVLNQQHRLNLGDQIQDQLKIQWNNGEAISINNILIGNSPINIAFTPTPFTLFGSQDKNSEAVIAYTVQVPVTKCGDGMLSNCAELIDYKIPITLQITQDGKIITKQAVIDVDLGQVSQSALVTVFLFAILGVGGIAGIGLRNQGKSGKRKEGSVKKALHRKR